MSKQKKPSEIKTKGDYGDMYEKFLKDSNFQRVEEEETSFYIKFCRLASKYTKAPDEFKDKNYADAVHFVDLPLEPSQINAAPKFALMLTFLLTLPILAYFGYAIWIDFSMEVSMLTYVLPVILLAVFGSMMYFQNYPLNAAKDQKTKSLTEIPEIVNYMVMSMKLTPNLERAVDFAAEHGKGKISKDLKKLVHDVRMGEYNTMEEALDKFAYKWGGFSDAFKHSLMLIRSSIIEVDDAKRHVILDKAASDVLESINEEMSGYATTMRQPSIYLYYMGVLLPLLLIIILPVASVMGNLPVADTWILITMYNVVIPVGTILFALNILKKRPPVYNPPKIPDSHPGLPRKNHIRIGGMVLPSFIVAIIIAIAVFAVFSLVLEPVLNPPPESWDERGQANWVPFMAITGGVLAVTLMISTWLYGNAYYKRKEQKKVMEMEVEFQDSIYVVASRLGENRPIEEALDYTAEFMKGSEIAKVYSRTSNNIHNLGMTVDTALFDSVYGSLKNVPSESIHDSMHILIDSIKLGVQQGSKALMGLSLQLRDATKIRNKVKELLTEITSMMQSIAFAIAPLVLGITTALQKIVISALSSLGGMGGVSDQAGQYGSDLPIVSFGSSEMLSQIPSPTVFLFIIGFYVLEVTLILTYFTSRIQEGNNDLSMKMTIANALPISMLLFFASAFAASMFSV